MQETIRTKPAERNSEFYVVTWNHKWETRSDFTGSGTERSSWLLQSPFRGHLPFGC